MKEGLQIGTFKRDLHPDLFSLSNFIILHHGSQTDGHVPAAGGPLLARSHPQLPAAVLILWELHHSP